MEHCITDEFKKMVKVTTKEILKFEILKIENSTCGGVHCVVGLAIMNYL